MTDTVEAARDRMATSFGARKVEASDKQGMVRGVFERVARRYDLMNDLMSGGIHRLWKEALIDWMAPRAGTHLLDVAGGTGDIAFRFLDRLGGDGEVTVCDINPAMLEVGRDRGLNRGKVRGLSWVAGSAESLPFPERSFDIVTIAFGIRNVTHIDAALADMRRVLKPGGRFMCLEFSRVILPLLDEAYRRYSRLVIPRIGQIVARDRGSYQYLVESIENFPDQTTFADMIGRAGFEQVKYRNLSGGIAAIHSGWRL
ncbi:MAG: bifunctional demethylmenaquinone methyltransferase/2-methoxy-6-polyprenyl-1,4-benzoquinol methylase UbiE [Geminicoccaceae bacterium]